MYLKQILNSVDVFSTHHINIQKLIKKFRKKTRDKRHWEHVLGARGSVYTIANSDDIRVTIVFVNK